MQKIVPVYEERFDQYNFNGIGLTEVEYHLVG